MKCTAIILAAGQGKRMNSSVQKQFLVLQGKPLLYYSLECFQKSEEIDDIILVTGKECIDFCKKEIIELYGFTKVSAVVSGGKERYDSVYAGLCACKNTDYVFIHDGAKALCHRRNPKTHQRSGSKVPGMCGGNATKVRSKLHMKMEW